MSHRTLTVWTIGHFLVDWACILTVMTVAATQPLTRAFWLIISYNLLAFATQLLAGALTDRLSWLSRWGALACVLTASALFLPTALLPVVIAGCGNALFHVAGGTSVLRHARSPLIEAGIFVSTGALGVFLGTRLADNQWLFCYRFGITLALLAVAYCLTRLSPIRQAATLAPTITLSRRKQLAALGLILTVAVRSLVGLTTSFSWQSLWWWALAGVVCVMLGKASGGILAHYYTSRQVTVFSLLTASICFLLADHWPVAGLLAFLTFNMTMPITLVMLAEILRPRYGLAFGILSFTLFVGALPALLTSITLTPLALASASLLSLGLMWTSFVLLGEKRCRH